MKIFGAHFPKLPSEFNIIAPLDEISKGAIYFLKYLVKYAVYGHGHLRYIQATRAGLIKLCIFFIKSAFTEAKYIDIDSEVKTLEWIDPELEETGD